MSDTSDYITHADRLLFRAGAYPDKQFEISPEELAACAGDAPVDIDSGHPSATSPLDGKLGYVTNRRVVEEDGKHVLRGDVVLPTWLNDVLEAGKSNLSCTWDRVSKGLRSVSLVQNPRISDAVLMSAYAEFAGKRHSDSDLKDMQEMHDITCRQGATCKPAEMAAPSGKENKPMSLTVGEMFARFLGRKPDDTVTPEDLAEFGAGKPIAGTLELTTPDPKVAQLEAKLAAIEAEREREKLASFSLQANAVAEAARVKLYPYQVPLVAAAFARALQDDAKDPQTVTFSVGEQEVKTSRAEALQSLLNSLPAHNITGAVMPDGIPAGAAIFSHPQACTEAQEIADIQKAAKEWAESHNSNGHTGKGIH